MAFSLKTFLVRFGLVFSVWFSLKRLNILRNCW